MNTPPTPESETLRSEQILELLSQHIASNDRVVAAAERIEETLPVSTQRILQEHRHALDQLPAPVFRLPPSELPEVKKYLGGLITIWGSVLAVLVVAGSCTVLFFLVK